MKKLICMCLSIILMFTMCLGTGGTALAEESPASEWEAPDFSDIEMDFEDGTIQGLTPYGECQLSVVNEDAVEGTNALLVSGRSAEEQGVLVDVSRFRGQTIDISAWVKADIGAISLGKDIDGGWADIANVFSPGDWVQIRGRYRVPSDLTSLKLYLNTTGTSDFYVDALKVRLVGLLEDFEGNRNVISPRGAESMPTITVTNEDSHQEGGYSLKVEKSDVNNLSESIKLDARAYIGKTVIVSAYVKSAYTISLGFEGSESVILTKKNQGEDWKRVEAVYTIPSNSTTADFYFASAGGDVFYVDDISVEPYNYVDNVEEYNFFMTRWNGAGDLCVREEDNGNHIMELSERTESGYGIAFDASAFIGREVELSVDVMTDDDTIFLAGDIEDVCPTYYSTASVPGKFKKLHTKIKLPSNLKKLILFINTDGTSNIYVDNLVIKPVPIKDEYKVVFDCSEVSDQIIRTVVSEEDFLTEPQLALEDGQVIAGWFTDKEGKNSWDFEQNKVTEDITLYAKLPHTHAYKTKVTPATLTADGKITKVCEGCGEIESTTTVYAAKTVKLTKATTVYTYTGKVIKPAVTINDSKGKAIDKSNYTITYDKDTKSVGKHSVKVTFKNNYKGSKTFTYIINPTPTALKTLTAVSKGFKATWTEKTAQVTGYEIQYSTSSKFKAGKGVQLKTVKITKAKTTSKSVTKLGAGKKYYVRIRTYKTVGKTAYYSDWSKSKTVTTKK